MRHNPYRLQRDEMRSKNAHLECIRPENLRGMTLAKWNVVYPRLS